MYFSDSIYNSKFKETRGYLCGSFDNAPIFSKNIEVGCMEYEELKKHIGDRHHHNVCDEMTILIKGSMKERIDNDILSLKEGDFFFINPGTITELVSIEEGTVLLVIKGPSVPTDKIKD